MSNGSTVQQRMNAYRKDLKAAAYLDVRRGLALRDQDLTPEQLKDLKTSIQLTPVDTIGFGKMPKGKIWK